MKVILIGEENSKRTAYFLKAAEQQQVSVTFFPWDQWNIEDLESGVIKIDPLSYDAYHLLELQGMIDDYKKQLHRLSVAARDRGIRFLNHPKGILKVLDKVSCKKILQESQLPVTEMLGENPRDYDDLQQMMRARRAWSVFVKPVYGSGAAGVMALSMQPSTGSMVAYTSACEAEGELVQQKKSDESQIRMKLFGSFIRFCGWKPLWSDGTPRQCAGERHLISVCCGSLGNWNIWWRENLLCPLPICI